jgi:hypothetical protein
VYARNADWQMSFFFVLAVLILAFFMKLAALFVPSASTKTRWPFLLSPLVSPNSFDRAPSAPAVGFHIRRILFFGTGVVCYYWLYWQVVPRFELHGIVLSYLAPPALLLLAETVDALVSFLWALSGGALPRLLNNPISLRSLGEFWGRRWNLWFSDWFRYTIFLRLRDRPILALLLVFAVSGLIHEWAINVPLYFVTGRALFGSMMAYFLLQAVGMLLERRFFKHNSAVKIIFASLIILVPAPLLFNEGLLRALHLWAE